MSDTDPWTCTTAPNVAAFAIHGVSATAAITLANLTDMVHSGFLTTDPEALRPPVRFLLDNPGQTILARKARSARWIAPSGKGRVLSLITLRSSCAAVR